VAIGGAAFYYLLMSFKTGSFYASFLMWFYFSAFLHCTLRFTPSEYSEVQYQYLAWDEVES